MQLHGEQNTATHQTNQEARTARIRALNDKLRTRPLLASLCGLGRVVMTQGIATKSAEDKEAIWRMVREFNQFEDDGDPFKEHDFGAFDFKGERIFWKIDYYDREMQNGSADPSEIAATCRVLTILLASEY